MVVDVAAGAEEDADDDVDGVDEGALRWVWADDAFVVDDVVGNWEEDAEAVAVGDVAADVEAIVDGRFGSRFWGSFCEASERRMTLLLLLVPGDVEAFVGGTTGLGLIRARICTER